MHESAPQVPAIVLGNAYASRAERGEGVLDEDVPLPGFRGGLQARVQSASRNYSVLEALQKDRRGDSVHGRSVEIETPLALHPPVNEKGRRSQRMRLGWWRAEGQAGSHSRIINAHGIYDIASFFDGSCLDLRYGLGLLLLVLEIVSGTDELHGLSLPRFHEAQAHQALPDARHFLLRFRVVSPDEPWFRALLLLLL